jgi:hypothetical protein
MKHQPKDEAMSKPTRRADMVPHRQHFLWNGRIPCGHITVIAGEPSKGKSTLGYRIAADVNLPTIFISSEEVRRTIWIPRMEAAGVDPNKAWHHKEIHFGKGEEEELARLVRLHEAKLVIVDPLSNHLRVSISKDQTVRAVMGPYIDLMEELDFTLIFQVHVLRHVPTNAHPLAAVPAGVASIAKAVYLFAGDPTIGADENIRILACAGKFNFGRQPLSHSFELETDRLKVFDPKTKRYGSGEYARFISRGDSKVKARMLLVMMRPEDKDRKYDIAGHVLLKMLCDGPQPVAKLRAVFAALDDPPISWKTAERAADEMGIIITKDERDARKLIWELPPSVLDTLEEAGDDEVVIEEVEIDEPGDTFPEDWTEEE